MLEARRDSRQRYDAIHVRGTTQFTSEARRDSRTTSGETWATGSTTATWSTAGRQLWRACRPGAARARPPSGRTSCTCGTWWTSCGCARGAAGWPGGCRIDYRGRSSSWTGGDATPGTSDRRRHRAASRPGSPSHHRQVAASENKYMHRLLGVCTLSYFLFQPVLHDWCNKCRTMCHPVGGVMLIKESLLLIRKSSPCAGGGFPLAIWMFLFTICPTPYNRINKMCWLHR